MNKAIFDGRKYHLFPFYSLNVYFYSTSLQNFSLLIFGFYIVSLQICNTDLGQPISRKAVDI